jgi:hypothetical protein
MNKPRTITDTINHLLATGRLTQEGLDEAKRKLDADPAIRRARRGLGPFVVRKGPKRR